jgi:hypothetical protein
VLRRLSEAKGGWSRSGRCVARGMAEEPKPGERGESVGVGVEVCDVHSSSSSSPSSLRPSASPAVMNEVDELVEMSDE